MRDLEIRGAGNLLGESQSGHMAAVGYDLYCKMLNEAVSQLKGEKEEADYATTITAIEQKGKDYKFVLYEKANLDPAKIPVLLKKYGNNMIFKAEAVPYFFYQKKGRSGKEKGENVLQMLREIVESIRELRLD